MAEEKSGGIAVTVGTEFTHKGKPGHTTTEFYGTLLVHVVGLLLVAYGMFKGSDGLAEFGAILMGVTQGSYNVGRSMEKAGLAKALGGILGNLNAPKIEEG